MTRSAAFRIPFWPTHSAPPCRLPRATVSTRSPGSYGGGRGGLWVGMSFFSVFGFLKVFSVFFGEIFYSFFEVLLVGFLRVLVNF